MKSDRLLSALMLLQGYGRLSTREIAERLEISQRTAHRDMEALCVAGVPLIAHRGAQGGWELEKGWRTQVPGLDDAELQGLLMAQAGALGSSKVTAAAQRAFDKLMAALPAPARAQAESIRVRLHFDPAGWRLAEEDLSMLPVVQDALARDRKLTFTYTKGDGTTSTRTVDPMGIVCKQTTWYLVARTPEGMRTFRVSRMRDAIVLALSFKRPAQFDLAAHWKRSTATFKEQRQRYVATLALSADAVQTIQPWCAMVPVSRPRTGRPLPEDWQVFDVEFESQRQARFVVLGLGTGASTLGPEEFAKEVAAEVARMAESH
ncbi:MAG TPA: WYL domain-containing protein [Terracidiphilus sp.]|nr:WYL domain-containing protein [Terracidiphilus sp.]